MASTGQSPVTVRRDWDMPMVASMTSYWKRHPPVHILVAGYMGYKPEASVEPAGALADSIAAIAADFRDELPEHLRAALDTFSPPD